MNTRGDVQIKLGGSSYSLRYDWAAIGELIREYGDQFDSVVATASANYDVDVVATTLAIGLKRCHPDVFTKEEIMKHSPPLIDAVAAVNDSIMMAFYGSTELPETTEKKTAIRMWILKWIRKMMRV